MVDRIKIREWQRLNYKDPEKYLVGLAALQTGIDHSGLPREVRELRARNLKRHRETREAAIFTYGMRKVVLKAPIAFAMHEAEDYDFVTRTQYEDTDVYVPVQTKELPPHSVSSGSLESELHKLKKYRSRSELVIAYHLNRYMKVNFGSLEIPEIDVAAIYFFGRQGDSDNTWFISGGRIGEFGFGEFSLPQA